MAAKNKYTPHLFFTEASLWLSSLFLFCVIELHYLNPAFDPRWRTVSEYALGPFGWMMNLAFLAFGIGSILLVVVLWKYLGKLGRLGGVLMTLWGVGSIAQIFFPSDLMPDVGRQVYTQTGTIHTLIGFSAILCFIFAVILIGKSLARNSAWHSSKRFLFWVTILPWVGVVIFIASVVHMVALGGVPQTSLLGIGERVLLLANTVWTILISHHTIKILRSS